MLVDEDNTQLHVFLDESPAFVCEKISVDLEVDRMTDMAVNDIIKTKNVLYISRGQLKNHTSTVLNFNIGKSRMVAFFLNKLILFLRRSLHIAKSKHAVTTLTTSNK